MKKKAETIVFEVKEKGTGERDGIWTSTDDAMFSVIEVHPIPFFDLDKKRQTEIIKNFDEFFCKKLDFVVEIIVRPVNSKINKKVEILESLLNYTLNKSKKTKLMDYFNSFMQWFKVFIGKFAPLRYVYYLVVNYNTYYSYKDKEKQVKEGIGILNERTDFVINSLKSTGLKHIRRLTTNEINRVYESFLKFNIYAEDNYLMPEDWLNIYKKRHKLFENKGSEIKLNEKEQKILEKLTQQIHEKGVLYESDIKKEHKGLLAKERIRAVLASLERNPSIILEHGIFKFISIASTNEQNLYTQIADLEKIEMLPDHLKIANTFYKGIIVVANPPEIEGDFLNRLYKERDNLTTSIRISPESIINVTHHLTYELNQIEKKLNELALEGKIAGKEVNMLRKDRDFLKQKIEDFSSQKTLPSKLNLTFLVEDINKDDLDFSTSKVLTALRKMGFVVKVAINYQKEILKTIVPNGADFLKRRPIIVTNELLAHMFPFIKR